MEITVETLINAPIAKVWSAYTTPVDTVQWNAIGGADGVTVRSTFEAESKHPVEQQRFGWQSILNKFAKHVEASK